MSPFHAGHTTLRTEDTARGRPIAVDVWYPASATAVETLYTYGLSRGHVAESADIIDETHPAILLSHGAFGAANNYAWIAEHLARPGYLVAGVSHYGESYVYGNDTIDPAAAAQPWLRPQDCTFALDYLLCQSVFASHIDPTRIGALGHSSGGNTAIALGGAVFDPAAMHQYCSSEAARLDKGCAYARHQASFPRPESTVQRSYRDDRVKAIVALDPALGPGHDADALADVTVPVHLVGAVQNDFLPFEHHAGRYARLLPRASLTRLTSGEGHFIFLDTCQVDIEANGVPLCQDREGVSRSAVHEYLKGIIKRFFDQHLKTL